MFTSRAKSRTWKGLASGVLTGLVLATLPTLSAAAAPVYEITANWVDGTAASVSQGDVVNSEWHINVNDDQPAAQNGNVDDVTFSVSATNSYFTDLPDACLVTGVTTPSSISSDGLTLTCNTGTQAMGTAVVALVPAVVKGAKGDAVVLNGETNGQPAGTTEIPIENAFGMDMVWTTPSNKVAFGTTTVDMEFQWTLFHNRDSEAGPDSVSYLIDYAGTEARAMSVAPSACSAFTTGSAAGHPWSGGSHDADQVSPFVGTCDFVQLSATQFRLTLTGIDYSAVAAPTKDSAGKAIPDGKVAVASGQIKFRVETTSNVGTTLTVDAPTYVAPGSGATSIDDASNNSATKLITWPGNWSSVWQRNYTKSIALNWDDNYRVSRGTQVMQLVAGDFGNKGSVDTAKYGYCHIIDTKYLTFDTAQQAQLDVPLEYYVGGDARVDPTNAGYNPNTFDCGVAAGWTTTEPSDLSTVKAVRIRFDFTEIKGNPVRSGLNVFSTVKDDAPIGQDVWQSAAAMIEGVWSMPNAYPDRNAVANGRYPSTTIARDVFKIVSATPIIAKTVDQKVVTPGAPATYTLDYQLFGTGVVPEFVDGVGIVDTLPLGMTYVPATASVEPTVSVNGDGRQVLTWAIDAVKTNEHHLITYDAVADDTVVPGQNLKNEVSISFEGLVVIGSAQVTVGSSGRTIIGKSADQGFIPNVNGDGVGDGSWTVTVKSTDPLPQAFTDTIDVLPYVGDGRGTAFSGTYSLTEVTASAGATVYYTTADPATLSDDPANPANGAAGDTTGNTNGWSETFSADATAVRVIGGELKPGATEQFTVAVATDGAIGGDALVNRAQARGEHTALVMRTSAPITVANSYSASLKKYVQDAKGEWHDANDDADYPSFRTGDTVSYRIVIENTGQGTLTGIEVTDDLFPTQGSFTVASLASGESEAHDFSVTLDESLGGNVVNTASATADTPVDALDAPSINSDPAGILVANYVTVKTSDPVSGSSVNGGDIINYTVTVSQVGTAAADAVFTDDLSAVLDDATFNDDAAASTGDVLVIDAGLSWSGTLPVGGVATITYSVTVNEAADRADSVMTNVVTSPGCEVVDGSDVNCGTQHLAGTYTVSKTSNPVSTTTVGAGQKITYTVQVSQVGPGALREVKVIDDLSRVLDDATWTNDVAASSGQARLAGTDLTWTGDLAVKQVVTITYSVTVGTGGNGTLVNKVRPASPGGVCVAAADENPDCTTTHAVATAGLAVTGGDVNALVGTLIVLIIAGAGALLLSRRRQLS
ncbi:DUF7927 domain-containing protein [Lysinibacter cavernae]|uniref:Putative repeat protein (TIGR01451 family) n=1 Tax=Lysinibacter cavernae TaxID=1640652 RepID=A0A7X5R3Y4_9MICO|nr:DUF11 domain-containing protein [Lysinibacter cavernae]NIH55213.1 putative repeat protein (TIGR01451 family) [Lysinibacter cavernae]